MNGPNDAAPARPKIEALVEEFIARRRAGEDLDSADLVLAHADVAPELERRLAAAEVLLSLARAQHAVRGPAPLPSTVGRYHIRGPLGRGSSSVVYHAYDPKFDRDVALKVFRAELSDAASAERFDRDARHLARLRHSHIVPLHEAGTHAGLSYIDMELIPGESLEQRLQRAGPPDSGPRHPRRRDSSGPLPPCGGGPGWGVTSGKDSPSLPSATPHPGPPPQGGRGPEWPSGTKSEVRRDGWPDFRTAAELIRKVAAALHHAHQAGIVHRDVKPSNILIDADGEPQLTDFGLARRVAADDTLTATGQVLGTPAYMSPEQARGQGRRADARSDVFSLGVVFYRLLTGRLPFAADDPVALLRQIADAVPPRPRAIRPDVPRDLETVCLKALEKNPDDRFATAAMFADELRRWLADEPLTIRPPTRWERGRRWLRAQKRMVRLLLTTTAGLLAVSSVLGWLLWVQRERIDLAQGRQAFEAEARAKADARSLLDQAWQRVRSPAAGRRFGTRQLLRDLAKPRRLIKDSEEVERIDLEARSLFALTLALHDFVPGETIELPAHAFYTWPVAMRPDGGALAIATIDKPIVWRRGQKPALPEKLEAARIHPRIGYSPDGRFITLAPVDGGLHVWDGDGAQLIKSPVGPNEGVVLAVQYDVAATTLRACFADGRVRSWSVPAFQESTGWTLPGSRPAGWTAAQFASDNKALVVGSRTGQVQLCDAAGELIRTLSDPADRLEVQALAWSPDGQLIAVGFKGGRIHLRRRDGTKVREVKRAMVVVQSLEFTPDGNGLLAGGRGTDIGVWDVATGELLLTYPAVSGAISRDGRTIATGDLLRVTFGDIQQPMAVQVLRGHTDTIEHMFWSGDGRRLATLDAALEVRVWGVDKGVVADAFPAPIGDLFAQNASIALNHDGSLLAYASSGERESTVLIRDVVGRKDIGPWANLPGGFDFLAPIASEKFRLVRERLQSDPNNVQTYVHDLEPGRPPGEGRLMRAAQPTDTYRFLNGQLTPDGRYYCWVGPRLPLEAQRVEVWEVGPGKRISLVPVRTGINGGEPGASLDPTGRYLLVHEETVIRRHDLLTRTSSVLRPVDVGPASSNGRWQVFRENPGHLQLSNGFGQRGWLWLDVFDQTVSCGPVFSGDSRRIAWGTGSGLVCVADLEALKAAVDAFEAGLRSSK